METIFSPIQDKTTGFARATAHPHRTIRYWLAAGWLCLTLAQLTACSTLSYYQQSISGHLKILWHRQDITTLIDHPKTLQPLKEKLQQALTIRKFASEQLSLPDNDSYKSYVKLPRKYVVWNITAAPEFSLSPKNWCYPVVGCVSYRGYYAESDADQLAEQLSKQGLDTHVRGVAAYSTLGWFDDPILSTMINWNETHFSGVIFHELSHQVLYIKNDVAFNEAFALATEKMAVITWLAENKPDNMANYLASLARSQQFRQLLLNTRTQLETLYSTAKTESEKRREKRQIFTALKNNYQTLKDTWHGYTGFDFWFDSPVNNARLAASMNYLKNIPAFIALFKESKGVWPNYYQAAKHLGDLPTTQREQQIQTLSQQQVSYREILALIRTNQQL